MKEYRLDTFHVHRARKTTSLDRRCRRLVNLLFPGSSGPAKVDKRHCEMKMLVGSGKMYGKILCSVCGYTEPMPIEETQPDSALTESTGKPFIVQAKGKNRRTDWP